ncbi:MAG: SusE domain-containing protein, partial [Ferruginibacter sp.]
AVSFSSCKKDESKAYYNGGTAPVLSASSATLLLSYATKDDQAISFSWTNPNYQFSSGISSQDVSYTLEIDTTGSNFTNPGLQSVVISKELSVGFTQSVFNDYLLNQLVLKAGVPHNVEIRVKSAMINNTAMLISNVLKFVVTPYAIPPKVTPPGTAPDYAEGKLVLVGDATPGGWSNPVPVPSQQFTRISATLYEITIPFNAGSDKAYLALPVNGDWAVKYGFIGGNKANNADGDDFKMGGGDILAPAASGNYKIQIDFQRGKFTAKKL